MTFIRSFIDQSEQDKEAVNYLLEDGYAIRVLRTQTTAESLAGFDDELTDHSVIMTIHGRVDPKSDKYVGLTDYLDCQTNDVWRVLNVRDEHKYYIVKAVKPRVGGCQVDLEPYRKWKK